MRALVPAVVALAAAGCSFPNVEFSLSGDDGGTSDASAEAQSDARTDGHDPLGGDGGDAGDGGKKDAAFDPCDLDRDDFTAKGGVCGGLDCDDNDARRNPGVSMFLTFPTSNGDWNCDTIVDKQFTTNVSCGSFIGQTQCEAAAGFSGDPACGASASYVTCAWNLVAVPPLCTLGATTSQTQGCR